MKTILLLTALFISAISFAQDSGPVIAAPVVEEKIFMVVDRMPEFPKGEDSMNRFIKNNIHYPVVESRKNIQGRVIVKFVVEKDGSLSNISIFKGISPALDTEAIRVISIMPKFIPGRQQGAPVRVEYVIPVKFQLNDETKIETIVIKEGQSGLASEPVVAEKMKDDANYVFNIVEDMPQFPGGEDFLNRFIKANLHYPEMESQNDIQGKVVVRAIVEKDGSLTDLTVMRSVSSNIDKEALRIIGLMPKFKPGSQQKKMVRVSYYIPIDFKFK